eukprot:XP_001702163.1 predicted protein [Chlamydomonas reinhardtii]
MNPLQNSEGGVAHKTGAKGGRLKQGRGSATETAARPWGATAPVAGVAEAPAFRRRASRRRSSTKGADDAMCNLCKASDEPASILLCGNCGKGYRVRCLGQLL